MQLKGKVALVTGGAGGVGGAVARRLGAAGATVIIGDLEFGPDVEMTASDIAAAGGSAHLMKFDQRSPASIEQCAASIRQDHGRLDILVNSAAWNVRIAFSDLDALTPDVWDRISETN